MRSADNVLPEYLDAVGPLLTKSPRLVEALLAWLARLLRFRELCWPTARLLLLAAREPRERAALPGHSLGRLPPELVRGRILGFLAPPMLPAQTPPSTSCSLPGWCVEEDQNKQKDVIAVLAHFIMFAPPTTWPRLSAVAFFLAELALTGPEAFEEDRVYLAASIIVTIANRLDSKIPDAAVEGARAMVGSGHELLTQYPHRSVLLQDLHPLVRLAARLSSVNEAGTRKASDLSKFVHSRVKTALEVVRRVQERLLPAEPNICPNGLDRSPCRGRQRRCP